MNGPDVPRKAVDELAPDPVCTTIEPRIDDTDVRRVIDLIDRPAEKPWGAGEPSAAIVPSAIGNAIFDATGIRLRSVSFRPAKVLAALRAA